MKDPAKTPKPTSNADMDRDAWLGELKSLMHRLAERDARLNDCQCPELYRQTEQEKREGNAGVLKLTAEISSMVKRMLGMEGGRFGVTLLLAKESVTEETATVLYCCIATLLDEQLGRSYRRVENIVSVVAARDPIKALKVRSLFRNDSPIHNFLGLNSSATLGGCPVIMKERLFNMATGLKKDESEYACQAEQAGGRWN